MKHWTRLRGGSVALLVVIGALPAQAQTLTSSGAGFFFSHGANSSLTGTLQQGPYRAGASFIGPTWYEYRNYFIFDLSGVSDLITQAQLHLYSQGNGGDASETYQLTGTSASITELVTYYAPGVGMSDPAGQAVFSKLGTGTFFSSVAVTSADAGKYLDLTLNADGLSYLNARRGGLVALTGRLSTLGGGAYHEYVFDDSNSGNPNPFGTPSVQLKLATAPMSVTPEAPSLVQLLPGLLPLGIILAKRTRKVNL